MFKLPGLGGKGLLGGIPGLDKLGDVLNSPIGKMALQAFTTACPAANLATQTGVTDSVLNGLLT